MHLGLRLVVAPLGRFGPPIGREVSAVSSTDLGGERRVARRAPETSEPGDSPREARPGARAVLAAYAFELESGDLLGLAALAQEERRLVFGETKWR